MFSRPDLDYLKQLPYDIIVVNNHDATIHTAPAFPEIFFSPAAGKVQGLERSPGLY